MPQMKCPDLTCVDEQQKATIDAAVAALQGAADAVFTELQPLFDAVAVAFTETFDTMQPVITFTIKLSNDDPFPADCDELTLDIID